MNCTVKNRSSVSIIYFKFVFVNDNFESVEFDKNKRNEHPFPVLRPYSVKNPFLVFIISSYKSVVKDSLTTGFVFL